MITMIEIDTPLGLMVAAATNHGLCLLEFTNRIRLEKEIENLKAVLKEDMQQGRNAHVDQLEKELREYFAGHRKYFLLHFTYRVLNSKRTCG